MLLDLCDSWRQLQLQQQQEAQALNSGTSLTTKAPPANSHSKPEPAQELVDAGAYAAFACHPDECAGKPQVPCRRLSLLTLMPFTRCFVCCFIPEGSSQLSRAALQDSQSSGDRFWGECRLHSGGQWLCISCFLLQMTQV